MRSVASLDRHDDALLEEKCLKANPGLKAVYKSFQECKVFMDSTSKRAEEYFDMLHKMLREKLVYTYDRVMNSEERTVLANRLAKIDFVEVMVEYYNFALDEYAIEHVTNNFVEESFQKIEDVVSLVLALRDVILKYSRHGTCFSERLMETSIMTQFLDDLDKMYDEGLKQLEVLEDTSAFTTAVGTIHNCARNPNLEKERLRDMKAVDRLVPFLQSELPDVKMLVVLALTDIVKDGSRFIDEQGEETVNFLFESIVNATQAKDRKSYGFTLTPMLEGLLSLARIDKCKHQIMAVHPLPVLMKLMRGVEMEETITATNIVWELAFLDDNKRVIMRDKELLTTLEILKKNRNHDVQYAARMTLFMLIGRDEKIRNQVVARSGRHTPYRYGMGGKHVMISYSWGDKTMVHEICRLLKSDGYPLWLDVTEMNKFSTTLEGHLYGVEHAYAVMVFFSEKYKNTRTCRIEAEYAYVKKKELIAVKLERGYTPDGWLRPVLGNRTCIEFSPHYHFDQQMDRVRRSLPLPPRTPTVLGHYPMDERLLAPTPAPLSKKLKDWTKDDIEYWAMDNKFEGLTFKRLISMNGEQLLYVYKVLDKSDTEFFQWAEKTFRFGCPEDLLKFKNAIQALKPNV